MLGSVEYENGAIDSQGSNKVRILGAVASLVDLGWMVDLLHDFPFHCSCVNGGGGLTVATNLAPVFIVVAHIGANSLGNLDLSNLNMIRFFI